MGQTGPEQELQQNLFRNEITSKRSRKMSSDVYRRCIAPVACLIVVAVVAAAYAGPQPSGSGPAWATLAPVPSISAGVEGMSVASLGDKIVAALGFDSADTATTRI